MRWSTTPPAHSRTPPALLIHPQPLQQLPATTPNNDQSQTRRATEGNQSAQTSDPDQTGEALQMCDPIHTLSIREYGRLWYMFSPSSERSNEPKRSNTMTTIHLGDCLNGCDTCATNYHQAFIWSNCDACGKEIVEA